MNTTQLRRSRSSSSLSSSETQQISDFTSSTSSLTTIPGPGALSGKAIRALGKAVLRGAEKLIIRQRLRLISSKFPHTNVEYFEDIDGIYKDLLELSRSNLYHPNIRLKAVKILIVQIGSKQTRHILTALNGWPSVEIQLLISELTFILDPIRLRSDLDPASFWSEVVNAYRSSLPLWENHSLIPFLEFLRQVGELRDNVAQAVLQGGALDFLFRAYVTGFLDPLWTTDWINVHPKFLRIAGHQILSSLCTSPSALELIRGHPISSLWPTTNYKIFGAVDPRKRTRLNVWLSREDDAALSRLLSVVDSMGSWSLNYENDLYNMFVDSLELAGSDDVDLHLSMRALRNLYRMSSRHKSYFQICVVRYLASSTPLHYMGIFSKVISRIHSVSLDIYPETELFLLPSDSGSELLLYDVIHIFLIVAEFHETFLAVLKASDILGLLRHLIQSGTGIPAVQKTDSPASPVDVHDLSSMQTLSLRLPIKELEEHSYIQVLRSFSDFISRHDRSINETSIEQQ